MKSRLTAVCALLLAVAISACSSHGIQAIPAAGLSSSDSPAIRPFDTQGGIPTGRMAVAMGDAAPSVADKQLTHFYVAICEIDATGSTGREQTIARYQKPLVVDVLQYQDGTGADVGQSAVTEQTYRGIRFVVDVNASKAVFSDGSTLPLSFAYGSKSRSDAGAGNTTSTEQAGGGLVAITDTRAFTIGVNVTELVDVDFNLFESLAFSSRDESQGIHTLDTQGGIPTGSAAQSVAVRPSLFVTGNNGAGQIEGRLLNENGDPVSNAVVVAFGRRGDIGNSTATDAKGNFELHTIAGGAYRLDVYNDYTNAAGAHFESHGSTSNQNVIRGPQVLVTPGQTAYVSQITD